MSNWHKDNNNEYCELYFLIIIFIILFFCSASKPSLNKDIEAVKSTIDTNASGGKKLHIISIQQQLFWLQNVPLHKFFLQQKKNFKIRIPNSTYLYIMCPLFIGGFSPQQFMKNKPPGAGSGFFGRRMTAL